MNGDGSCNPVIEIYQSGRLVFSTRNFGSNLHTNNLILRDPYNIIFRTVQFASHGDPADETHKDMSVATSHPQLYDSGAAPLTISKDIEIRFYNQRTLEGINDMEYPMQHMFSFTFNTCFISAGLTRVRRNELEFPPGFLQQNDDRRVSEDFSIDLILSNSNEETQSISYTKVIDKNLMKCLAKLSQFHYVKADLPFLRALEIQGYKKIIGS